jgi:hypothetical protein
MMMKKTSKKSKSKDKDWEKDMGKKAKRSANAREKGPAGGGGLENRISLQSRRFTLDQENLGRTLKVVVVDFCYLNTYYAKGYSKDGGNIPKCFAIDMEKDELVPHDNVKSPQAKSCDDCPMAYQGGRTAGKCQNRRRLAVISADDLDDVENADIAFIELPPKSLRHWSAFVKDCDTNLNKEFFEVIVELSFDEDEDYPVVLFDIDKKIKDKEVLRAIESKQQEIRDQLLTPFDGTDDSEDDEDDEDDDEDDDKPRKKGKKDKKSKASKKSKRRDDDDEDDEDDDDDEEDDEDEDEEDEDEKPKRGKGKKRKSKRDEEDDEDDEEDDEDDDEDDEDDDEDEEDDDEDDRKSSKRRGGKKDTGGKGKRSRKAADDDDDDDDDDEDDDEDDEDDEEDEKPSKKSGKGKVKSKKGSRFGKK